MMVFEGELFGGEELGLEGEAFKSRISALRRETQEPSLIPCTVWGHSKKMALYEPRSELSPDTKSAGALILEFQLPEQWEINICWL